MLNSLERRKDSAHLDWSTKPRRSPSPKDIEFQTAEMVIPNPSRNGATLPSFSTSLSETRIDKTRANRLIWGDNLLAMQALLSSGYEGKIKLIYIDPPFWTGEDYYANVTIGGEEVRKSPSIIERLAYKDIWGSGVDSYLDMLYPRLQLMRRLLTDDGALFLHCDYHVGHYVKVLMDAIFGRDNFRNEIHVKRIRKNVQEFETVKRLNVANDSILFYTKSENCRIRTPTIPAGKEERWHEFSAAGLRTGMDYELFGHKPPPGGHWRWTKERAEDAIRQGILRPNPKRGRPEYLVTTTHVVLTSVWDDISAYSFTTGFPTEKSEKLLTRILEMASNQGDLVADFFCGSGTTLVAAESTGRRWLGCDFSKTAIQIARNRLVHENARPFLLENIGNYQRQLIYLAHARIYEMQTIVLKLYGATPRTDLPDMGVRRGEDGIYELVHVGYPDRLVTAKKVSELAQLAEDLDGQGYDRLVILGWDYEYNFEELFEERKRSLKTRWTTDVKLKSIPPEVYDYLRKAKAEEDIEPLQQKIHFHDKPFLKLIPPLVQRQGIGHVVTVGIEKYALFDYPIENPKQKMELMELLKKDPLIIIDYWAIDWNYDGVTFRSTWQAFRNSGRQPGVVPKSASQLIEDRGARDVAIRVVDVFGNDAANTLKINLR